MKTGNYDKKHDLHDVSLFAGRAYMPTEKRYEHYLKTVPQLQKEASILLFMVSTRLMVALEKYV